MAPEREYIPIARPLIGDEEKRANKAASNKRRLENRQRIADEPKGSKKDAKNKGKRK